MYCNIVLQCYKCLLQYCIAICFETYSSTCSAEGWPGPSDDDDDDGNDGDDDDDDDNDDDDDEIRLRGWG